MGLKMLRNVFRRVKPLIISFLSLLDLWYPPKDAHGQPAEIHRQQSLLKAWRLSPRARKEE
jgi:hypothetical protein